MASYDDGKQDIVEYICQHFPHGSTCLDVGACDGKWHSLLGHHLVMDAVEIFEPNVSYYNLADRYRHVYTCDVYDLAYDWYDLIIFGDVIEHMTIERAQTVLNYAEQRCHDMIIGVPYLYKQEPLYGNEYERHIQDDLTEKIFKERYPGYEILAKPRGDYAYYHATAPLTREKSP